jgi:hypothetical protein
LGRISRDAELGILDEKALVQEVEYLRSLSLRLFEEKQEIAEQLRSFVDFVPSYKVE